MYITCETLCYMWDTMLHVYYMWDPVIHVYYMWDPVLHVYHMWYPVLHVYHMWDPVLHVDYMWDPMSHASHYTTMVSTISPWNPRPVLCVNSESVLTSLFTPELCHLLFPGFVKVEHKIWYRVVWSHTSTVCHDVITLHIIVSEANYK